MTIQTIELNALQVTRANPRKTFNEETIEGLAASIRQDGLLQNLIVQPSGKKGTYEIVSGERRFRALSVLAERGEIEPDHPVVVEVRDGLSEDDTLRIATVENLHREDMTPLEEAEAFRKLIHHGTSFDDLVAKTGLSASTIKRRCALNGLSKAAKAALADGEVSLSQAEALSLGSKKEQNRILELMESGSRYDAEDIRESLFGGLPTVAMAIFPVEEYKGTFTRDLFGSDETTYFNDADQFMKLQRNAVDRLADEHLYKSAWLEVTGDHRIRDWLYEEATEGQHRGTLINFSPSGQVEIRENLYRPEKIDPHTANEAASSPAEITKAGKSTFGKPLCQYLAHHKSAAVQAALLARPAKARQVAVARLLHSGKAHKALEALAASLDPQAACSMIEEQAARYADRLGIEIKADTPSCEALLSAFSGNETTTLDAYEAVEVLSDEELDDLHLFLTTLSFGQERCDSLDTGENVFNRVASDIGVDMREFWKPDFDFLNRRNAAQCREIAKECGFADGHSFLGGYKKGELVNGLIRHFAQSVGAEEPNEAQRKALDWLPPVMHFPAIDHDRQGTEDASDIAAFAEEDYAEAA